MKPAADLAALRERWLARWPEALAQWSRFTQLRDPRWCATPGDEERESLSGSFAMIRLDDTHVAGFVAASPFTEGGIEGDLAIWEKSGGAWVLSQVADGFLLILDRR